MIKTVLQHQATRASRSKSIEFNMCSLTIYKHLVRLTILFGLLAQIASTNAYYYHFQQSQQPTQANPQTTFTNGLLGQASHLQRQDSLSGSETAHRSMQTDSPTFRFHATPQNATAIRLSWNLISNSYADKFELNWGPLDPIPEFLFSVSLNGTAREFTVTQLEPDAEYQFELKTFVGDKFFKPILKTQRTPSANYIKKDVQENPELVPFGVRAEAKSNNSVQLSWTEKERQWGSARSPSKNYTIRYYVTNPSSVAQKAQVQSNINDKTIQSTAPTYYFINTTAKDNRVLIHKLKPGTEYAFAVKIIYYFGQGTNLKVVGHSTYSMDTTAKTFDPDPSAPKNFTLRPVPPTEEGIMAGQVHPDKLELTWAPPDIPNGPLWGYVILYGHEPDAPDSQWMRINIEGGHVNNWFVTKIKPGYTYFFKLRAINMQERQGADSVTRRYDAPPPSFIDQRLNGPIPPNNILLLIIICMVAILFLLFLIVSRLACRSRRKPRKAQIQANSKGSAANQSSAAMPKLNGFASTNSSAAVTARVGTLARRRDQSNTKPDYWISALDQSGNESIDGLKLDKSNQDLNMAMVSIQRDSPQFATTQLAPALPEYSRFDQHQQQQLLQQLQHQQVQGHYHPSQLGTLNLDQMDSSTAQALMTLSKRQQQQLQKYQFSGNGMSTIATGQPGQAPSPHQQPPPPPPLNIEHQQQPLYGTHQATLGNTRSLRLHRPTLYDPVSGSFVQGNGPPNYSAHPSNTSNAVQFYPQQTSTLMSRRSTNTLRSFQTYGQIGGNANAPGGFNQFSQPVVPPTSMNGPNQSQQLLQTHQAVINQLNNSTYPSLPLKHVSTVRPQIMSSLEDQIEMELAEKEPLQSDPTEAVIKQ